LILDKNAEETLVSDSDEQEEETETEMNYFSFRPFPL
jgi:hypothetical protein